MVGLSVEVGMCWCSRRKGREAVLDDRVILCGWTLKRCLHGERAWSIRGGDGWFMWFTVESLEKVEGVLAGRGEVSWG